MLCEDCTKGFTLDGNPEGKTIDGGAYFHAAPSGTPSKAAVVLLTDIFGLGIPNPKILADQYSQALDIDVYVPDYFNGKPPFTLAELAPWEEPRAGQKKESLASKAKQAAIFASKATALFANRPSVAVKRTSEFIQALRKDKGYKAIGTIGFCYGGGVNLQLGGTDLVDSVIIAHPGGDISSSHIAKVKQPAFWLCSQEDKFFSPETRKGAEREFAGRKGKQNEVEYQFIEYAGTTHGFACRPAVQYPEIKTAFEKSVADTINWFKKTVVDKAAAAPEAAPAAKAPEPTPDVAAVPAADIVVPAVTAAAAVPAGVVSTTEAPVPAAAVAAPVETKQPAVEAPKVEPVVEAKKEDPVPVVEAAKPEPVVEAKKEDPVPVVEAAKPDPVIEAAKPEAVPEPVVKAKKEEPVPVVEAAPEPQQAASVPVTLVEADPVVEAAKPQGIPDSVVEAKETQPVLDNKEDPAVEAKKDSEPAAPVEPKKHEPAAAPAAGAAPAPAAPSAVGAHGAGAIATGPGGAAVAEGGAAGGGDGGAGGDGGGGGE